MTEVATLATIIAALDLPPGARVDTRVPKKMLVEQGAPTAADKRAIQDGIDELQWIAALKPTTIAIPAFTDQIHDFSEIAVIAVTFRADARTARLTELIHRAIPYPVLLITIGAGGVALSVAPKRAAQNEGDKVVVERVVGVGGIDPNAPPAVECAFLDSLALKRQPSLDLSTVYGGWLTRIEALQAAQFSGSYSAIDDAISIERRHGALEAHSRLTREITGLRAKANREKQMNRRVGFNMEVQRLEAELATHKKNL